MKITVLYGGPSSEREISLISGKAVADGLLSMGHEVHLADIGPDNLTPLETPADLVFPVLHGEWGESGELQEILEKQNLRFVGSGSRASCMGMDKVAAKQIWERAGLPTPTWAVANDPAEAIAAISKVGLPCVAKAVDAGSSIDVYLCETAAAATDAANKIIEKYGRVLIEKLVKGKELTVAILDEEALPPIWIDHSGPFYDYDVKYNRKDTNYRFDLDLPAELIKRIQDLAVSAHKALGCRHLSRVDLMLDEENNPFLLEINTMPGFTPKSLLPKAAKQAGLEFGALVDKLAHIASGE